MLNTSYTMCAYLKGQYNKNKRQRTEPTKLVPISFIEIKIKQEKNDYIFLKALFDLGTISTLIIQSSVRHLKKSVTKSTVFHTTVGNFSTHSKCQVKMRFLEFNPMAEITYTVHVTKILGNYNLIISHGILHKLGVGISFSTKTMSWNNVTIDMKPQTCTCKDAFHVDKELFVSDKTDRIAKILYAKYKPEDLKEITYNLPQLNNNNNKITGVNEQATRPF